MPKELVIVLSVLFIAIAMVWIIATNKPPIECSETQAIVRSVDQGYICVENPH
jgi:hypothetical protein